MTETLEGGQRRSIAVNAQNNRLNGPGMVYDAAGNLIEDNGKLYTYDAENRILIEDNGKLYTYDAENRMLTATVNGVTTNYFYDGEGKRIKKIVNGQVTRFVYGIGGELIAEYDGATVNPLTPTKEYLFGPTGLLAVSEGTTLKYLTPDHLGSTRVITDTSGQVVARQDFYPFGREIEADKAQRGSLAGYGTVGGVRQKFTGYLRDEETGLDFAQARYYSSTTGRYSSVDPIIITPERFFDPQQLNLFSYTRNNPLRFTDPTGEKVVISGDIKEIKKQLAEIIGTDDAEKRISYDQKTGIITVDLKGIDLKQNEGASLLNDVIGSEKTYGLTVGSSVNTLGGQLSLIPTRENGGRTMANLDNNPDDRFPKGKFDTQKPPEGVDDQIGINFDYRNKNSKSKTKLKLAPNWTLTFHELAEAYSKVEGNKQYAQAHQEAINRETRLRDQRPYLKEYNPGSGPGTEISIKK